MSKIENDFSKFNSILDGIEMIINNINESIKKTNYCYTDVDNLYFINNFNTQISNIRKRIEDPMFYIGIIGEFSCGKSTFINAFIECKYLYEDILQGTTCSKTVIYYGDKEDIIVECNDGKIYNTAANMISGLQPVLINELPDGEMKSDKKQKSEQIKEILHSVTAVEENAQKISTVTLMAPLEPLKDGLVIVDTPGIGSTNLRHTEVARRAAAECDALLVLTNLQAGMLSQDLIAAVREIAGDSAMNCIFVGTHLDLLPHKERKRMETFFEKKLHTVFGVNCPHYMVSCDAALKELETGIPSAEDKDIGLVAFRSFREKIKKHMKRNRQNIQSRKIIQLIAELTKNLDVTLIEMQKNLNLQVEKFQKMVIPGDSEFWNTYLKRLKKQFADSSREIESSSYKYVYELVSKMQMDIIQNIRSCDETSKLKSYIEHGMEQTIHKYNRQLSKYYSVHVENALIKEIETIQIQFIEKIHSKYHEIELVCCESVQIQKMKNIDLNPSLMTSCSLRGGNTVVDIIESEENFKIGGGLAAGIAISVMVPGVGWLVGGLLTLLGGTLGLLLCSIKKQQDQAIGKVIESIMALRSELTKNLINAYRQANSSAEKYLDSILSQQRDAYINAVRYYNEELMNKSEAIENIVSYINAQRALLTKVANQFCVIQDDVVKQQQN